MKKLISLILVMMMCISLAACSGKPTSNEPNTPPSGNADAGAVGGAEDLANFTALEVDKKARVADIEITGMKMDKESYAVEEPIAVTVTWEGTPAEDTWIGIIPAEIPHGSEETNDEYDIDYRYFTDMSSGDTFIFTELALERGAYTMRIHETDAGGAELAWCAFSVK